MAVLFGSDNWMEHLLDLAYERLGGFNSPAEQIQEEVAVVMPHLATPAVSMQDPMA